MLCMHMHVAYLYVHVDPSLTISNLVLWRQMASPRTTIIAKLGHKFTRNVVDTQGQDIGRAVHRTLPDVGEALPNVSGTLASQSLLGAAGGVRMWETQQCLKLKVSRLTHIYMYMCLCVCVTILKTQEYQ